MPDKKPKSLDNAPFRGRYKTARDAAGLNNSEVARRIQGRFGGKLSPQAAYAWEAGTNIPPPRRIEQIAQVLGVDPAWLAYGSGTMAPATAITSGPAGPIPSPPPDPDAEHLSVMLRPRRSRAEHDDAADIWRAAMREALPAALRGHTSPDVPSPWRPLDYLSPRLAVLTRPISALHIELHTLRGLIDLLAAGRLYTMAGHPRRLVLILTDRPGEAPPDISTRLAWLGETLGVSIQSAATAADAATIIAREEGI